MRNNIKNKKIFLEQLAKSAVIQIACEKTGIGKSTIYRWREKDPEFSKQIDDALLEGKFLVNDLAEAQLINAIKDRSIQGIALWLKHNHPNYKTRIEVESTVNLIQELSPEQRELVQKALTLAEITLK